MAKRLVVCCDGTWNRADQRWPTNILRFHDRIAKADEFGTEQRTEYFPGVGTGFLDRWTGGAFGAGLSEKVKEAYRWVIENFEPDDELFFVGFSRGAYTARSAVGLIRNCGVVRREEVQRIDEAYALYRRRDPASRPEESEAAQFRNRYAHETRIRFIGVWDTVGALGVPFSGVALVQQVNKHWQFHDTKLSSTVDFARQALAIDERRRPFAPAVWERPTSGQVPCHQVWFPGVHSDVGGGYEGRQLADVTLEWMIGGARDAGLAFQPGEPPRPVACHPVHDSMTLIYRLLVPLSRSLGTTDPDIEAASSTALTMRDDPACGYAPSNLDAYLARVGARVEQP